MNPSKKSPKTPAQPQFEQRGPLGASVDSAKQSAKQSDGPVKLTPLPYGPDALEPFISAETMTLHHDKHHKAYVDKANKLIAESGDEDLNDTVLEHLVVRAAHQPERKELFNNLSQAWNHSFFWKCLAPPGTTPRGNIAKRLESDLDGLEGFRAKFQEAAETQFGSGWAWLVLDKGKLAVTKTGNAESPLVHGQIPLLTLDVWEHAYYVDYRNKRPDYAKAVIANLLNWDFAETNLAQALGKHSDAS